MDNSDRFQALSRVFDNIEYPKDFKPTNIQKYDCKQDSAQWLRLYSTAVSVAGGVTNTKVLYFPMALEPAPLTWLESLARESIHSWGDLKKAFINNLQGSLHRVATRHALSMCKQEQEPPSPTSPTMTSSTTSRAALLPSLYTITSGAIAPKR